MTHETDDVRRAALEELMATAAALIAAGEAAPRAAAMSLPLGLTTRPGSEASNPTSTAGDWARAVAGQLLNPIRTASPAQSPLGALARPATGGGGSLASGLLQSVVSPLFRLFSFGGGDEGANEAVSLPKFVRPAREVQSFSIRAADEWSFRQSDYDGTGRARAIPPAPQIVVQVNAMDSRSFVDHSQEIADAVKRAVLESNSLGDLFRETEG